MYNDTVVFRDGTISYAGMAELADALDSGSSESNFMEVQVLLPAPKKIGKLFACRSFFCIEDLKASGSE